MATDAGPALKPTTTDPQPEPSAKATDSHKSTSKEKRRKRPAKNLTVAQFTLREPEWAYIHLQHLSRTRPQDTALDEVTAHLHLTAALSQFLGLHGRAVPLDVLKLAGEDVWVRVPNGDRAAVVAAAGGWVSRDGEAWRVKGWSSWDASASGRDAGQDLFAD